MKKESKNKRQEKDPLKSILTVSFSPNNCIVAHYFCRSGLRRTDRPNGKHSDDR